MSLNLAECVELSARQCPDKTAVIHDDVRLSYKELAQMAKRVANILRAKGIGPGDKVALMLPNTPHFPIVYFGILYAGAAVVAFNCLLKKDEIIHQLTDCEAVALFAFKGFEQEAVPAVAGTPCCKHLVLVEPDMEMQEPALGESFLALMAQASPRFDMVQTMPDDPAVFLYTAATDGWPMAAELTHFNMFQNAVTVSHFIFKYRQDDVCMCVLPLFHAFGQTTMMNAPLLAGASITMAPRFDTGKMFEIIRRDRVTLLAMVPTMFHFMVQYKQDEKFDMSSVLVGITGGSAMPRELAEAFTARFGIPVLEGYGLTETSPVVAFNRTLEENKPGSIGTAGWGMSVRTMRQDGSFAETGEEGEVVIRGHNVMRGYYKKPEANQHVFAGGWLHTGDLGYIDEDGFIFLTGRLKDMVIRAGLNVYPREVERVLEQHPAVAEAAVIGVVDLVRGEEVLAFVVLQEDTEADARELASWCRDHMAPYKVPRKIEVIASLPRDEAGRVCKDELRMLAN
jgi:long-chain acyl-CoA synthetase